MALGLGKVHKYLMYVPGARRFGSAFSLVSTCTGDVMLAWNGRKRIVDGDGI